ncbi:MAG: AMP-binding protein, partial [Fibrobacteres bacterium]|nr:AMP-binding protein [Fibrobacterota bacterium]
MNNGYIYNLGQLFTAISNRCSERQALRYPDGTSYTFSELEKTSNKIAEYLLSKNLQPRGVVAVFNNKTFLSYSVMLACLKIGVVYTNLDPNSPIERLKKMILQCNPDLFFVFSDAVSFLEQCAYDKDKTVVYNSDEFERTIAGKTDSLPAVNTIVSGTTPAYLMFTSGSTGFPKGVTITHANVLNFIEWTKITYNSTPEDVFTNINPMHFDNSVFDFYASLFIGATLAPVSEELAKNPRKLLDAMNVVKPTIWFSVPSMLVYVLKMRALKDTDLPTLRIVTFGGEGFPKGQLRNLWAVWGNRITFINVYGPTECTCICSSYIVSDKDMNDDNLLPLGPIAPNFGFVVINEENQPVKDGEIGELCITGPNVSAGYY